LRIPKRIASRRATRGSAATEGVRRYGCERDARRRLEGWRLAPDLGVPLFTRPRRRPRLCCRCALGQPARPDAPLEPTGLPRSHRCSGIKSASDPRAYGIGAPRRVCGVVGSGIEDEDDPDPGVGIPQGPGSDSGGCGRFDTSRRHAIMLPKRPGARLEAISKRVPSPQFGCCRWPGRNPGEGEPARRRRLCGEAERNWCIAAGGRAGGQASGPDSEQE